MCSLPAQICICLPERAVHSDPHRAFAPFELAGVRIPGISPLNSLLPLTFSSLLTAYLAFSCFNLCFLKRSNLYFPLYFIEKSRFLCDAAIPSAMVDRSGRYCPPEILFIIHGQLVVWKELLQDCFKAKRLLADANDLVRNFQHLFHSPGAFAPNLSTPPTWPEA